MFKFLKNIFLVFLFSIFFIKTSFAETTVSAEVGFIFNTLFFLICGFLVMFMAAGFAML